MSWTPGFRENKKLGPLKKTPTDYINVDIHQDVKYKHADLSNDNLTQAILRLQ